MSQLKRSMSAAQPLEQILAEDTGEGIFAGIWHPSRQDGTKLGLAYHLFAAPEDLGIMKFEAAGREIAARKDWYGWHGEFFGHEAQLYSALLRGIYCGGWIIPTIDMLCGTNSHGVMVHPNHLYKNRERGFNFITNPASKPSGHLYWSCSVMPQAPANIWAANFATGEPGNGYPEIWSINCRPVRLKECAP